QQISRSPAQPLNCSPTYSIPLVQAIIGTLCQLKQSKGSKWTIKGKLINVKKENNVQLFYVENAVLSFGKIVIHVPLLKMKSIDL
ncbi:hypothetical protein PCYB_074110, partial [Plasmodium cynomolgi strain B]